MLVLLYYNTYGGDKVESESLELKRSSRSMISISASKSSRDISVGVFIPESSSTCPMLNSEELSPLTSELLVLEGESGSSAAASSSYSALWCSITSGTWNENGNQRLQSSNYSIKRTDIVQVCKVLIS